MPSPASLTCWIITEGHAGMVNQCAGLAEALGLAYESRQVAPRAPWVWLPSGIWPWPLSMAAPGSVFAPPWPDVVISCGRRSVATALAVRRAANGKTFAIHIQDPHVRPDRFDVLVVPEHDRLKAANVIKARGNMNHLTRIKLDEAAKHFAPLLKDLPRPLISVLIGGSTKRTEMTTAVIDDLADKLIAAAQASGYGLAVTPSRRTGAANEQRLRERLQGQPAFVWDGRGENPYFGLMALADGFVVTSDSTNLACEAAFTGKPVHVYHLDGGSKRFDVFHTDMEQAGMTRPFLGKFDQWSYNPLNETARVAAVIRERLAARG